MPTEREWAEAFKRLDTGVSSYEDEAKRLGVGKGTVYRHHIAELQRRLNQARSELNRVGRELSEAEQKRLSIQRQIQELMKRKDRVEKEIHEAKERLESTIQGLKQAISMDERLQRLGLEKVSELTNFIDSLEALKFDVETVKKLAEWRKSLAEMGIDPDGLEKFVREKGPLEAQLRDERRRLESLRTKVKRLWYMRESLQSEVSGLSSLATVLKKRKLFLTCKVCGAGILVELPTRGSLEVSIKHGMTRSMWCPNCGNWAQYSSYDILSQIGWLAIPT